MVTPAVVLGLRVKQLRAEKFPGRPQYRCAFEWGLTPQLLNALEQGRRMPRLLTAKKISDALEVPLEVLLDGLSNSTDD